MWLLEWKNVCTRLIHFAKTIPKTAHYCVFIMSLCFSNADTIFHMLNLLYVQLNVVLSLPESISLALAQWIPLENPATATSKKAVMLFSPKVTVNVFTTDKMSVCLQWNYVPVALHSGDAINVRINQNETQINPVAVVTARAVASRRRPREMTICYLTFRLFAQPKPNAVVEVIIAFETNSCVKTFRSGTLNLFI